MKVQLVSDLHLEFLNREQIVELADRVSYKSNAKVLILSGDICSLSSKSIDKLYIFLNAIEDSYSDIIYILGNHEYYGTSKQEVHELGHKFSKKYSNLHILDNESVTLENITFYGTTLWFKETVETSLIKYSLNDYRCIKDFTPDVWCRKAISYIRNIPDDESKKVLITHHVPNSRFISPKYVGNDMNCFYLNEIGEYLNKFDLVIFGHSHDSVNYQFSDRTLALSNPRGYLNSKNNEGENDKFNYRLLIEV
jgi:predicted phosphodiesterase